MNDEYAETVVLRDAPLGRSIAAEHTPPAAGQGRPDAGQSPDEAPAPTYPAFEDTSWLT